MNLQWIGAFLIIAGCGGVGFGMALSYKREESALRQLLRTLEYMRSELEFRMTPLPELCRKLAAYSTGSIRTVFRKLAKELDAQVAPDAQSCMHAALKQSRDIPGKTADALSQLGHTMGQFDLQGQLRGICAVMHECEKQLKELECNRTQRLRSYQTLGLCAGAALAILFI